MNTPNSVVVTLTFKENFTNTVRELISDGEINTIEELKSLLRDYILEDVRNIGSDYGQIEFDIQ